MVAVDVITGPYDVPWVPKKGRTRPTETTYARWYSFSLIEVDLIVLHKPNTQILVKTRIMNLKGKLIVFSIFDSQSTVKILLYTAKIYFILIKKNLPYIPRSVSIDMLLIPTGSTERSSEKISPEESKSS